MNCGSNLDEDLERENVYFSHYCYPCFGLFMKRDSFLFEQFYYSSISCNEKEEKLWIIRA